MNDGSVLDAATIEVIRSAVAAAAGGRTKEACEIGERGLRNGGDPVALHAMVGSILYSAGELEAAITHLQAAHQGRPSDPLILKNLARALVGCQRYDEALSALNPEVVASDPTRDLLRLRGFAAQETGHLAEAIEAYEEVVRAEPYDWEMWNNLGNARAGAGDLKAAVTAIRRAAQMNPQSISTRLNLARTLRDAGEIIEADAEYRRIADEFPDNAEPLTDLFALIQAHGGGGDSETVLKRALERAPNDVKILVALGRQYLLSFSNEAAEQCLRRALELEPTNGDAYLALSDLIEHTEPQWLPKLLAEAESAGADVASISLIRALIAQRERRHREGLEALEKVPADFEPIQRWHLIAQHREGVGDFDGAFEAFSRTNETLAADPSQPLARAAVTRAKLREQLAGTTAKWRDSWVAPPLSANVPAPVFLVGFPRSGTTLLDTMLMGHPDVEVMEEKPVLYQLRTEIGRFDALAEMSEIDVRRTQERYFEIASSYAELRKGSLLVDKSPLHMQNVAQIYRLFPDARFILALRHPADVVLSCFMAKFRLNDAMVNFLRLDTAAEYYDLTFALWEQSLELFPADVHTVVYEKMIVDSEAQLRPIVEGLGLSWRPEMLDHERTAAKRGIITTASYAQVTQPLYRSAIGRWERYRKHLEPVLPTLAPWIEKLGYEL